MGGSGTQLTPWTYQADDYQGRILRITVNFDNATREIIDGLAERDAGCVYANIYVGIGPDGTPETSPTQFAIPEGTNTVPLSEFTSRGFVVIEDILPLQITAGP